MTKRPHDEYRLAAEHAVVTFLVENEQNFLADGYVWRAVNAALDAYDEAFIAAAVSDGRYGWAILRENGTPWIVCPTYRSARRQRAGLAVLADTPRWRLRIVKTAVIGL